MGTAQSNEVDSLIAIVRKVLADDSQAGFEPIMEFLVNLFQTDGAIVWEVGPEVDLTEENPKGRVFVLAAQTPSGVSVVFSELPLEQSKVGLAVLQNKVMNSRNIWNDPQVHRNYPPLTQANVWRLLAAPVDVPGGGKGVVSLYGTDKRKPFSKAEEKKLEKYAELIPGLFNAVRAKTNYALVGKVNDVIRAADVQSRGRSIRAEAHEVFQQICDLLAEAFNCLEATIVMQDTAGNHNSYLIVASSWDGEFRKRIYTKDKSDGITGWILAEQQPVRLLDLCNFERDKESMSRKFPGMVWHDPVYIKEAVLEIVKSQTPSRSEPKLPPVSFVAVPIVVENKAVGVVRCAAIRPGSGYVGPFFFCSDDQRLLTVIAGQLGQYWSSWLKRRSIHEENLARGKLVEHITALNNVVERRLVSGTFVQHDLFYDILRLVAATIDGADALDIRLYDKKTSELYFAYTWGQRWKEGNPPGSPASTTLERRFPVKDETKSAGAHVFKTNKVYHIKDTRDRKAQKFYEAFFDDANRMIVAPIEVSGSTIGVLDIHGFGKKPFAPIAETAAQLVGRQIGLYQHLSDAIMDLQKTQRALRQSLAEREKLVDTQSKTFADVAHQLRGPLVQARLRARMALEERKNPFDRLDMVSTLVRRALRVTTTMRVLDKLYRDEPIPLQNPVCLKERDFLRMLQEAAKDNEAIVPPYRNIKFRVDVASLFSSRIDQRNIQADVALIEQAINSLLDNAGKYSYSNTRVNIIGGQTKTKRFQITVRNTGVPISPREAPMCALRGWRADKALTVTGEGSGIGLFIVDHIMRAHNGELIVIPTNENNETDVKLVFPA